MISSDKVLWQMIRRRLHATRRPTILTDDFEEIIINRPDRLEVQRFFKDHKETVPQDRVVS